MPKPENTSSVSGRILQRKCACGGSKSTGGECEECKKKELQRKPAGAAGPVTAPRIVHEVLASPGQRLDKQTSSFFEARFGHDFSRVRVHTDEKAAESARGVNALAYTVGHDLVFGQGRYAPTTTSGQRLLAHELSHVVQQEQASIASPTFSGLEIGAADDAAEREAEHTSHQIIEGTSLRTHSVIPTRGFSKSQLRRQNGDDQPKKQPKPLIPLPQPFEGLDIKPVLPLPGGFSPPSLEDVHKGYYNVFGPKDQPADVTCPTGWKKRTSGDVAGLCCPGDSIDKDRCCPPSQMTMLGTCCKPDGVDEMRLNCAKKPGLGPGPSPGPRKEQPQGTAEFTLTLPPMAPLTVDLLIHFKEGQPKGIVTDEKALKNSLAPAGDMELDAVIGWLQRGADFSTQLTGMASIEGTAPHNRDLGEYRVRSVANALLLKGIGILRISDPPGSEKECPQLGPGMHNCGDTKASKGIDANDRQVRARMFIPQKPTVISGKSE
jgi:hypothetical protein